jgi:prevent-host-death family protein
MKLFNVHQAKSQLSKLLQMVEAGEEVSIARNGRPVVRLVKFQEAPPKRQFGQNAGEVWIGDDFNGRLPDDILALFE